MSDKLIKSELLTIEKKCSQLEQENLYLRQLLNIPAHEEISIPAERSSESIVPIKTKQSNSEIEINAILSPQEKIRLFRSFFRGRDDVYATRWENKNGQSGYSPACANEWDKKVCRKPQIKCSDCVHKKWLPITDQVIHDHLTGKKFLGVYPLNLNETCSFIAIDFDKDSWQKDAVAFLKTCQNFSVSAILERSQSGNGGHVWIFFENEISANIARSLGTALLSQTMQECHTLRMESYDRLFPNQDTLPKGGFGNLIALPLQGNRRVNGNSIFLDENLNPCLDPWKLLSTTRALSHYEVMSLLGKLQKNGNTIDVRSSQTDEEKLDPWISIKSNKNETHYQVIDDALPAMIELVLVNLIYIPVKELPAKLINQIKKIAAFQNPEFYSAQAMRLSTYGKPRVIYCAEEFEGHIGLPRGCESDLLALFENYKIEVSIIDKTQPGKSIDVEFKGELRPEQKKAFDEIILHRYGILSASTAFGKTVLAAKAIAARKTSTLILVHRQQLLDQWKERLSLFLETPVKSIGTLSNGKNKLTGNIDIAMLQSLSKKGDLREDVTQYGQIIVDECHHLSAFSFEQVLKTISAKYVLGLTATPIRKDGHHPIIIMQCGPIRYKTTNKNQSNIVKQYAYICNTQFDSKNINVPSTVSEVYSALALNNERNEQIFNDVLLTLENKRKPLLLTERTQHLQWFADKLNKFVKNIFVLQGGMKQSIRQEVLKKISELPHDAERLIIATGQYVGEGFDDPLLDTLFLALPISWHGKLQQYVGRLHRFHENKKDIVVYDYVDRDMPMLNKMYQKRFKKYKAMGYSIYEK